MKHFRNLLALTTVALAGSSLAASNPYLFGGSNAGISLLPEVDFGISLGGGADEVVGPFGLRGLANLSFGGNSFGFGVETALTYTFESGLSSPYVGLGAAFDSLTVNIPSGGSFNTSSTRLVGLVGADLYLNNNGRIFVEAVPTYNLAGGDGAFNLGLRAGLKLNLD